MRINWRCYSIETVYHPALIGLSLLIHLALVIWHGVSVPPKLWHRGLRAAADEERVDPALAAAMEPLPDAAPLTPEQEHQRYAAFKARGPHFWPEVIADDAIVSLIVFLTLVGLTIALSISILGCIKAQQKDSNSTVCPS